MPSPHRAALRRGRGLRGVMFLPNSKAYRTRKQRFDGYVLDAVHDLGLRHEELRSIEFGVEEVPPSSPAPWESHGVVLARLFPADKVKGLKMRLVIYRQPIVQRCDSDDEVKTLIRDVIIENASGPLGLSPDDFYG